MELQQCYKAQSRLSDQLVVEVAESRALKAHLQEKETAIPELEKELNQTRFVFFYFFYFMVFRIRSSSDGMSTAAGMNAFN